VKSTQRTVQRYRSDLMVEWSDRSKPESNNDRTFTSKDATETILKLKMLPWM